MRKIGSGTSSNVYLAVHENTFATVAIKLLLKEYNSSTNQQMFATEASLCGRLQHPNIVAIHKADLQAPEGAYLVLDYVDGNSLDWFAQPNTLLPMNNVIDAIRQAAEGLKYASGLGIIHRDVKPDNLILTAEGHLKLTDFGCAITNQENVTPIGVAGSIAYMSPEQISGKKLNHQSDIYALGAVLYRLLSGYYSFDADSTEEAVFSILNFPAIPVNTRRQGIPAELNDIINRSMQINARNRHETWDEFILEIEQVQKIMRTKHDDDFDMLRGFSEATRSRYLSETIALAASRSLIAQTRGEIT